MNLSEKCIALCLDSGKNRADTGTKSDRQMTNELRLDLLDGRLSLESTTAELCEAVIPLG